MKANYFTASFTADGTKAECGGTLSEIFSEVFGLIALGFSIGSLTIKKMKL